MKTGEILALLVAAGAVCACVEPPQGAKPCDVAHDLLSRQLDNARGPVVVVARLQNEARNHIIPEPSAGTDWKDPPSAGISRAYRWSRGGDVLACSAVRQLLARRNVPSGEAAAKAAVGNPDPISPVYKATILSLGMPVVSRDGREALVETGVVCGPLCGAGSLLHLRRDPAGAWRVTGSQMTWIS
jgi:hypothetical protein